MIPPFDPATGNLPEGIHEARWVEFAARFGWTQRRVDLLAGLTVALDDLKAVGCRRVFIDGSFVTAKDNPGDFDACWELDGVDLERLRATAPVLLDFSSRRAAQKARYGGELFIAEYPADLSGTLFVDFFRRDKRTGRPKGIVVIHLGELP